MNNPNYSKCTETVTEDDIKGGLEDGLDRSPKRAPRSTEIGRILAAARVRASINAIEMAEKLSISTSYLSMIERGKRDLPRSLLMKITNIIEIPPDDIKALWAKAKPSNKKIISDFQIAPEISNNAYKQEIVTALCRALSRPDVHVSDVFKGDKHSISFETSSEESSIFKLPMIFNIEVKDHYECDRGRPKD